MENKDSRKLFDLMNVKRKYSREETIHISITLTKTEIAQLENRETILIMLRGLPFDLKRSG